MNNGNSSVEVKAKQIVDEWKATLPTSFIIRSRATRDGGPAYPELHFVADDDVPGLYFADVPSQTAVASCSAANGPVKQAKTNGASGS